MSCSYVNNILKINSSGSQAILEQPGIAEHIATCDSCAQSLRDDHTLNELISRVSDCDNSHTIPMNIMRSRVEIQINDNSAQELRPGFAHRFGNIASLSIVLTAIIAIYLFTFDSNPVGTNGYAVALDGVLVELVDDNELLCDAFYDNGLPDASYDLIGCESTCRLVVYNLRTRDEAIRVVNILHSLGNSNVKSNVIQIKNDNTEIL